MPDKPKDLNFKEGDKIIYRKKGSEKNGMSGIFLKMREDGKFSIRFDDGTRLAANPKNVYLFGKPNKELDPYDEENWYNEDDVTDNYKYRMININNTPGDFYFHVGIYDNIVVTTLTSILYFNRHGCVDDGLGSHCLSRNVKNAMNRAGVNSGAELMESMWEGLPGRTEEQIRNGMINEGFVYNEEFVNFINNPN